MDKFLGRSKTQKVAAVEMEGAMEVDTPVNEEVSDESDMAETVASATLTQLLEQQKALSDQIAAWREEDF
jgi:hypothetical protein